MHPIISKFYNFYMTAVVVKKLIIIRIVETKIKTRYTWRDCRSTIPLGIICTPFPVMDFQMSKIGCELCMFSQIWSHICTYIPQTVLQVEWPRPDESNLVHKDYLVIHCHYNMVWIISRVNNVEECI